MIKCYGQNLSVKCYWLKKFGVKCYRDPPPHHHPPKLVYNHFFTYISALYRPRSFTKQGDNALGSVHPSVCPFICQFVRSLLFWCAAPAVIISPRFCVSNNRTDVVDRLLIIKISLFVTDAGCMIKDVGNDTTSCCGHKVSLVSPLSWWRWCEIRDWLQQSKPWASESRHTCWHAVTFHPMEFGFTLAISCSYHSVSQPILSGWNQRLFISHNAFYCL